MNGTLNINDWTFAGEPTRDITHCYHDYPARMIPQIPAKLLGLYGNGTKGGVLFDPYTGSGTSLVEGVIRGFSAIGTDLNPLARLIASAKVAVPDMEKIDRYIHELCDTHLTRNFSSQKFAECNVDGIKRLDFWFKPDVVKKLFFIREFINNICESNVKLFFQVAFSETVRECSNTRNGEFKLLRYKQEKLSLFSPDVFLVMLNKLERNRKGLENYARILRLGDIVPRVSINNFNTVEGVPHDKVPKDSVDIVITSPPYGDSATTVAYGQYSRLSAAWLKLEEPDKIDQKLMGGKRTKNLPIFTCEPLNAAVREIFTKDDKRALEVAAFYSDLKLSISNVSSVIKPGGYACYVVGNRKVKCVVLPTDLAIVNFFESSGLRHVETFVRNIPNKRMPLKNSPTNVQGVCEDTMTKEYVIVMRK